MRRLPCCLAARAPPVVGGVRVVEGVLAGAVHAHEAGEGHAAPHEAEQDERRVEQEGRADLLRN